MRRGIVMGKERRSYVAKDGTEKVAQNLFMLWDESDAQREGASGALVEAVFVSRLDISNIKVHDYCEFDYDIMPGRNGMIAVLAGIKVLGHADVMIERPKA